jgi:KDO2-lipid IV(A) lauroyltransferase
MATKGTIQTSIEYALARALLAIFGALPLPWSMKLGRAIGRLGFWFPRLRGTAERNLEIAFPQLSEKERKRILHGCFENLGRMLAVFSHFDDPPEKLKTLIHCDGIEHLEAAESSGRGVILFTGHIGAWELSSFALSLFDHPLSFLVRRIDNPKIEAMIDRTRTHLGNRTIDKRSAAREMLQILRGAGTLGILVDLNALDREAIFVDFFGVPASTTFLVAKLALRANAQVLPVFSPWDEDRQRFVLKIDEPLQFQASGDETEDVRLLTQMFTSVVEKYVRRYPDQWLWIHRRWKTRPAGEKEMYRSEN